MSQESNSIRDYRIISQIYGVSLGVKTLSTCDRKSMWQHHTHCKRILPQRHKQKYYKWLSHSHTITPSSVPITEVLIKPVEWSKFMA